MKKTLAAVAVLGAFAGSALAADVTLYGLVDLGLDYQNVKSDVAGTSSSNSLKMRSGTNSGSRFGLKGVEQLGNGYSVGFVLENQFSADDGTLAKGGRLFEREASLQLKGPFGTLAMGRQGQLANTVGTFGLLGVISPFSSGWGDAIGPKFVTGGTWAKYDNTVTYATPTFAGLTVFAQYSFGTNNVKADDGTFKPGIEGESSVDRYYGLGAKYVNGGLTVVGTVDSVNYASVLGPDAVGINGDKVDDSLTVNLGGNYDFGVVKTYLYGQYFKNSLKFGVANATTTGLGSGYSFASKELGGAKGYALSAGVDVPAFGGTAKALVAYGDAEAENDSDVDVSRWVFGVGYAYNLSKRTSFYTGAAYIRDDVSTGLRSTKIGENPSQVEVTAGLIHKF